MHFAFCILHFAFRWFNLPEPLLQASSISFRLPGGRVLFENVDLITAPGDIIGITGSNGTGKTTLLRILAGLLEPACGIVHLTGSPLLLKSRTDIAKMIGYLPQSESVPLPVTVEHMVLLGRFPHMPGSRRYENKEDRDQAGSAMKAMGIEHLSRAVYGELSGGEKMRVRIARLLTQQTLIKLLDEPTTHLDKAFRQDLVRLLRGMGKGGGSAIIVSHDTHFLSETCNRIYRLEEKLLREIKTHMNPIHDQYSIEP